jgi:hypothetical protein
MGVMNSLYGQLVVYLSMYTLERDIEVHHEKPTAKEFEALALREPEIESFNDSAEKQ